MAESHTSSSHRLPAQPTGDQREDQNNAPVSPYVLESFVCDSLWTAAAIEEDVAVTAAHRELAPRRQSNDKQPYATFLINALSLLASTSASPDASDDDQAVLFDSAVHHIACSPDWVAVQVPLRELRQTVQDTMGMVELVVKAQGGKSVQEGIPCIEQISIGDVTKEPCALLAALDHSARYNHGERYATGARVRTGAPMFMACELSSSTKGLVYGDKSLKRLGRKLRAVEELGPGAFPGDDGTFMEKFQLVLEAEEERLDSGVK